MSFFRRGAPVATADAGRHPLDAGAPIREPHGCLDCRLVQRPTRECAECGGSMVAPLAGLRELMSYRDMNLIAERDMWMITALLAGGSIMMPFLLPVSLLTLGASAVQARRRHKARRDQPIAAIVDTRPAPPPEAVSVRGRVTPLRALVARPWDGGNTVAAELAVRWVDGLFLRATASAPFVIDGDEGAVVVTGVYRFAPPMLVYYPATPPDLGGDEPRLAAIGVPATWRFAGQLHVDEVTEGQVVRATGLVREELVPERATFRDGGVSRVMRGTPGAPVLLETTRVG
jgi:hypothetical protein